MMITTDAMQNMMDEIEREALQLGLSLGIAFYDAEQERSCTRRMENAPRSADLEALNKAKGALEREESSDAYVVRRGGAAVAVLAIHGVGDEMAHHACLVAGIEALGRLQ